MSFEEGGGWNCGLGRCCRTSVSLHWMFWFNVAFQVVFAVIQYPKSWKYILLIFLVWGPVSIITLLFHEMGHIWRTRSFGGSATHTMLWPLGGFNDAHISDGTCLQEFWVAVCGPLMHIPQIFAWMAIMALSAPNGVDWYGQSFDLTTFEAGAGEYFAELSKRTIDVNIIVFVINLILPAYPLDAASMVAAMAVHCGSSVETAGLLLVVIGVVLGIICIVYGIISLVGGSGSGLFILLIGLFVLYTSWTLWKTIQDKTIHLHPIFKPDCYKGRSDHNNNNNDNRDVEMGNRPASPKSSAPPATKGKANQSPSKKKSGQKKAAPRPKQSGPSPGRTNSRTPKK
jgi:hypothetical protein